MHSMEEGAGDIWVDGRFTPWAEAKVHILSYTFQHGAGVFEGVRAYDGARGPAIFRLYDHTRRLFDSAKILGMEVPFSHEEVSAAQIDVVRRSGLKSCYIRPVCYYDGKTVGVSAAGNDTHLAIAAWAWDAYLGADAQEAGITVKTSSYIRHHVNAVMGKAKANGHYINSMMAVMEARRSGYTDALMLDAQGHVAECSTSNIFVIRNGEIVTPDRVNILEGITRDTVMTLAADRGLMVHERQLTRDELYCADEIFVTGTAAEVTPVIAIDDRQIAAGTPGEITRMMQAAYSECVRGRDQKHLDWVTAVA
ncbi:branched-chain amino acid transaminase [Marinicaulis aureus]|uniref:Branched-chain-amino-acid aminotransferase n=1 Tax=Hyphococcus aureus TaxID=2666033 RepID=A0ABW1L013_9PROT